MLSIKFLRVSLWHMSIAAGVVVAVTFQQVDHAPDSETCAKCDDEGLKNIDSRVKEIHKCVCRNMQDIGLEMGSHNASAGTKTAVRLPIPASPFKIFNLFASDLAFRILSLHCRSSSFTEWMSEKSI